MRTDRYEYHQYDARSNMPAPQPRDEYRHEFWISCVQSLAVGLMLAAATYGIFFM